MIRVRIPATSANLGAGFDSLGLAVNLYNYVDMEGKRRRFYLFNGWYLGADNEGKFDLSIRPAAL